MISDEQAVEIFNKIKAMPFSNKSERGQRGCDLRAHKIVGILADHGIEDVQKGWIYSLLDKNGDVQDNVRVPIHIIDPRDDELDYDENGLERCPDRDLPKPYNCHVAPIIKTDSGRELVFDTFFYDEPPTLKQWRNDFKPFEAGTKLGFKRSDPSYLYFHDLDKPLPKAGSLSRIIYDMEQTFSMNASLSLMRQNPPPYKLSARWLGRQSVLEHQSNYAIIGL